MPQFLKKFVCICILALTAPLASGFALLGVPDTWQVPGIGYNPLNSDIGAPKNLGEEYRWTLPVITYGFDHALLNYFGSEGVAAVERAIGILNSLPSFSTISDMSQFPLLDEFGEPTQWMESRRVNVDAQALQLVDIKSVALSLLVEELGLGAPERWTWALRDRVVIGNPPITNYLVIQRNFDPVDFEPSYFVNGIRYTYQILEFAAPIQFADAVELEPIDPRFPPYNSVAGNLGNIITAGVVSGLDAGVYYTTLTRDDIGGLRYIYQTNNINLERLPATVQMFAPDRSNLILLTNQDLTLLSLLSLRSTPQQLSNFYPGIRIARSTPFVSGVFQDIEIVTNAVTVAFQTNRNQVLFLTNLDLTTFSQFSELDFNFNQPFVHISVDELSNIVAAIQFAGGLDVLADDIVGFTNVQFIQNFVAPGFITNQLPTIITNRDLYVLSQTSLTNPPVILTNLPGFTDLVVRQWSNYTVTNVVAGSTFVTNAPRQPWEVPGSPTNFIIVTNFVTNLEPRFAYSFANVITNYVSFQTVERTLISGLQTEPWSVPSNPVYRTNILDIITTNISGGYIVIPPGGNQPVSSYIFTGVEAVNLIIQTNFLFRTNFIDPANGLLRTVARENYSFFTNTQYEVFPVFFTPALTNFASTNILLPLRNFAFGNVITNSVSFGSPATLQVLSIQTNTLPGFPDITNQVRRTPIFTNLLTGDIFIRPTNVFDLIPAPFRSETPTFITNSIVITELINDVPVGSRVTNVIRPFTRVVQAYFPVQLLAQPFVTNVLVTNIVTRQTTLFSNEFANVITNPPPFRFPQTNVARLNTTITAVARVFANGVQVQGPFLVTLPGGGFVIDTNLSGFEFTGFVQSTPVTVTNSIASLTDPGVVTNLVYTFTNTVHGVFNLVLTNPPAPILKPGIDKLEFVRVGGTNLTTTNFNYTFTRTMTYFEGGRLTNSIFVISNAAPDILFSAADLGTFANSVRPVQSSRTAAFVNLTPGQGGPGVIEPTVTITFNNVGPSIINQFPGETTEPDLLLNIFTRPFVWGSFDGSTNPPIVFPEDITLEELELRIMNP